ncbi:PEP-CTERM sorting domain-containing protein [Colwellia sp. TT2012]|uniref:PEP-CTERM sorting domain-containing protein n=1 Tax=Colwellia sp. TT2012 TaxID=1720342 RepID=UPI000709B133|nr:PEP-CTERM sorting domain-containing protein [Colwellia sp. TT2012]
MYKVFSSLFKSALVIASLSQAAHANVLPSDTDFTFTWTAICGDCNSTMGEFDALTNIEVSGAIVLNGYTPGEAFIIDNNNLVSFSYDGPSIHIDAFTLLNNNNIAASNSIFESGIFNVSGSITADQSSFELDFSHTIWEQSGTTYYEYQQGLNAYPSNMDIHFGQDGAWAFNIQGIPWDFGVSAVIAPASNSVTDIPEPTTLAIFALSLMGLASRKLKNSA